VNGLEFFFVNLMIRIFQVPMLFYESSEFDEKDHEGCFVIMLYEKNIRKRIPVPKKLPFHVPEENHEYVLKKHHD